jgi:transposase
MYSRKIYKSTSEMCDQIGKLSGFYVSKLYPEKIRRVKFYDAEFNRTFVFLTNNMDLTAEQIALLYKNRWHVELLLKWIKKHLKIKSFRGTSENAVRIQIFCAIIAYCLVAIIGYDLRIDRSTYELKISVAKYYRCQTYSYLTKLL